MKIISHIFLVAIAFLSGWAYAPNAALRPNQLTVQHVKDGDSLILRTQSHFEIEVRLRGIDTPERHQPFGKAAKAELERLCLGKNIHIEGTQKDKYGRLLAQVYCADVHVNSSLIATGHGWVFTKYAHAPELLALQAKAKHSKKGLWAQDNPEAPWDYRQKKYSKSKNSAPL